MSEDNISKTLRGWDIEIEVRYGSKFQEQTFGETLKLMMDTMKSFMESRHKNNKLTYTLYELPRYNEKKT